ncbi:albusnodin family lasso peptide [Frankia sp. CcI49]|nr:albusnodin family lasso peptide [Frankia sp. CcI49]
MVTVDFQPHDGPAEKAPVLLVSLGEASMVTLGQGKGSAEDKRKAYNS